MRTPNHDARTFLIYVDAYETGVPAGQLYHPSGNGLWAFQSLTQLLAALEAHLDGPAEVRSFYPPLRQAIPAAAGLRPWRGGLATFSLHMLFRRNATWQGVCTWLETGQTRQFRSALELIFLLDSALLTARDPAQLRLARQAVK